MLFRQNIALPSFQYKGSKTVPEKLYDIKKTPTARLDGRRFFVYSTFTNFMPYNKKPTKALIKVKAKIATIQPLF